MNQRKGAAMSHEHASLGFGPRFFYCVRPERMRYGAHPI